MEKQERKQEPRREPQGKEEVKANPKVVEAGKKLKEDIDKLVDEIDDVLETNAEEFVKNYVQKGGGIATAALWPILSCSFLLILLRCSGSASVPVQHAIRFLRFDNAALSG